MSVSGTLIALLFVGLAAGWAVQMRLALRQSKRFHEKLRALRAQGTTAVGRGGDRLRGFVYVALAADEGRVVAAEAMSGVTVRARLHPIPELVDRSLAELAADSSSRRARAAAQAAEAIIAAPVAARSRQSKANGSAATAATH